MFKDIRKQIDNGSKCKRDNPENVIPDIRYFGFFFIWIGGAGAMVYILVSQQNAVSLILDAEVNISSNTKEKVTTYLKI